MIDEYSYLTSKDLRQVILRQLPEVKNLLLSLRAVEIVNWLTEARSARELADKYNISVQNASQQLSDLYFKGYLMRTELSDPTGGTYYTYWSRDLDLKTDGN